MQNEAIKNIDLEKVPNVDEKLKPALKDFFEKYADRLEEYKGLEDKDEKFVRLAKAVETNGINMSLRNKKEDEYLQKNPYVTGYFDSKTKEVVVRDVGNEEKIKATAFHELTHYVNGFDQEAKKECVQHKWLNESLTEESSAMLAGVETTSYQSYIDGLDEFISLTYGKENLESYKEKIMDAHLYGTKEDIEKYIPETVQYNLEGMFNQIEDIDPKLDKEIRKTNRKIVKKNIPLEAGKTIVKNQSKNTKNFLGIYSYNSRYTKYMESLSGLSEELTLPERERITRKQILRDYTDKAMKKKNIAPEKLITSLLKKISKDKIYLEDFDTQEGKTDILMEIARIRSYTQKDAWEESYLYSMNDIASGLEIEDSKVELCNDGESIKFDTIVKPKVSTTMNCIDGEEVTYGTSLLERNFKMESVTISSEGYVEKTLEKEHNVVREQTTESAYGRRMFAKKIAEETKKVAEFKADIMTRKKAVAAEINECLNDYFTKYIGKDVSEVFGKKNKKTRAVEYNSALLEGKEEKSKSEELLGMDSENIEKNPEKFANKIVARFTKMIKAKNIDNDEITAEIDTSEINNIMQNNDEITAEINTSEINKKIQSDDEITAEIKTVKDDDYFVI